MVLSGTASFQRSTRAINADRVPYFESQNKAWSQHEAALRKAIKSDWETFDIDDDDHDEGDAHDDHDEEEERPKNAGDRELPLLGEGSREAILPSLAELDRPFGDDDAAVKQRPEYKSQSRREQKEREAQVTKSDRRSSRKKS